MTGERSVESKSFGRVQQLKMRKYEVKWTGIKDEGGVRAIKRDN
jgi:hypothetical protein